MTAPASTFAAMNSIPRRQRSSFSIFVFPLLLSLHFSVIAANLLNERESEAATMTPEIMAQWRGIRCDPAYKEVIDALPDGFWGPGDVPPICVPHFIAIPGSVNSHTAMPATKASQALHLILLNVFKVYLLFLSIGLTISFVIKRVIPEAAARVKVVIRALGQSAVLVSTLVACYSRWRREVQYYFDLHFPVLLGHYYQFVEDLKASPRRIFVLLSACMCLIVGTLPAYTIARKVKEHCIAVWNHWSSQPSWHNIPTESNES